AGRNRLIARDPEHGVHGRRAEEGGSPREQLVKYRAQRINIGKWADSVNLASGLLRRHVTGRAKKRAAFRLTGAPSRRLAKPKSEILGILSRVIKMLAGFKSRCTMPRSCA